MSNALAAFEDTAERLFAGLRAAAGRRLPPLARLETRPWIGLAVAIAAWALIVAFSESAPDLT